MEEAVVKYTIANIIGDKSKSCDALFYNDYFVQSSSNSFNNDGANYILCYMQII